MSNSVFTDSLGIRHVHQGDLPLVLLLKLPYVFYPIGLAHVAGALKDAGIAYDIVDLSVTPQPDWSEVLKSRHYTAMAAGGLFGDYLTLSALFSTLRMIDARLPLILGGPITWDIDPAVLLEHIPADFLVIGEGEITLPDLIHGIASNKGDFSEIPGLLWRGPDRTVQKSARRRPLDLTAKNWLPDWDIVDFGFYKFDWMSILTGRGCTGTCTFCSPTNGRFRSRPISHIMEEIEHDNARYSFNAFGFHTEILFPDAETTFEFCDHYKRLKPHKPFGCLLRVDFPVEALQALCDAGCRHIHIGVESGSDRILDLMNKRTNAEMIRKFMAAARKIKGLTIRSSIMFGNYGETPEDIDATVDLACEMGVRQNTMLVLNYPGTANFRRAQARGLVTSEHDYLVNLTGLLGIWPWDMISRHNNREASYPNISEIDTPALLKKTEQALRRFYTTASRAKVARAEVLPGPLVEVTASCPYCGMERVLTFDPKTQTALHMDWMCPCSSGDPRPVYVPASELPLYDVHHARCAKRFETARRVAILLGGGARKADLFLWTDRIGLDFEKIVAFAETETLPRGWIMNHRVQSLEEIIAQAPDLYVVPYDIPRNLLKQMYGDSPAWGLSDQALWLTPEFSKFRNHLGAGIVHMLPFDLETGQLQAP